MAVASKPNIDATANISATPGAPWSAADGEKLSVRPSPSGPPPLKSVTRAKTIRTLNSASTKTARIFAPISMPEAPSTWTITMVTRAQTHHATWAPVWCSTRPLMMLPYSPYMQACTAQ